MLATHAMNAPGSPREVRVLHVDDDAMSRVVMEKVLRHLGCLPLAAEGVESALAAAKEGTFDLVITDHRMPDGGGLALLRGLRAAGFAGPVHVVSGAWLEAAARREYAALRMTDFFLKPIGLAQVVSMLDAVRSHARAAGED